MAIPYYGSFSFNPTHYQTAAFFTQTDISAARHDRAFALKYSIHKDLIEQEQKAARVNLSEEFGLTKDGISAFAIRNRYTSHSFSDR